LKKHRERRRALARTANIEIIPLRGVEEKLSALPAGTTITVTCSPKWGLERTLEHTASAVEAGFSVVPHLAARQITGERELREIVDRLAGLGIRDIHVIGGDAPEPAGGFASAGELLDALSALAHPFEEIGVACYPEKHPLIPAEDLLEALRHKQKHATYMVSQLCFDADVLLGWLRGIRGLGVTLPLRAGLAAPLNTRKLLELSVRIGVGSSMRYLSHQHGLLGTLFGSGSYRPEKLLERIARALDAEDLGIEKIHLYSFNQIAATVEWQRRITTS
jgi:methylenetetrahydrofolate reductase (NADPH)